jgi:hypothetical protein
MTTTSYQPGGQFAGFGTPSRHYWGDDLTEDEQATLNAAVVERFESQIREATGDDSISFCSYTSEILHDCRGQTDGDAGCFDPLVDWGDVDIEEIAREAQEWVSLNAEHLIDN